EEKDLFSFVGKKDMVAVKTHFGEVGTHGNVQPEFFGKLSRLLKAKGSHPFLTETSTLYRGARANAVEHTEHAYQRGFTFENTGMPVIIADGLLGDSEIEVDIPGKLYKKVAVASLIAKANALVLVSHFTGHMLTGFGAAIKNLGMGCTSRKAKLIQHSTAKPSIKKNICTGCGDCARWCPHDALSMVDKKAQIKNSKCVGCGECLAVCRFDAVGYNWSETYENLQHKMMEHAMAVAGLHKGKSIYINFLNRITKDCDCLHDSYNKIIPDIGVLVSLDPVAVDVASLHLAEQEAGTDLGKLAFDIPFKGQLQYAKQLGFGTPEYQLIEVS
ncbi:MAG: DUF362 domain-containing protein, partial [bacterium]|nr:DUF362 domain-containing protein [bacterium]